MKISKVFFIKSSINYQQCPQDKKPEIAFVGRSNVGKSSLINALVGSRQQFAKISKKPGKTQHINHFLVNDTFYLVDLPGYGWAQKSGALKLQWEKMVKDYLLYRPNLVSVFLLVDTRINPQQLDIDFINWMGLKKISFVIIWTKTDKKYRQKTQKHRLDLQAILKNDWQELPPLFVTSSHNTIGIESLLEYIHKITAIKVVYET